MAESGQAFDTALQSAVQIHVSGDVDQAIGLYNALLDEHPNQPDFLP